MALVGAGLIAVGTFLPWLIVTIIPVNGFAYDYGEGPAGSSLLVLAAAISLIAVARLSRSPSDGALRGLIVLAAIGTIGVAAATYFDLARATAVPPEYRFNVEEYRALISGRAGGAIGPGPIIAFIGGVAALLSSFVPVSRT